MPGQQGDQANFIEPGSFHIGRRQLGKRFCSKHCGHRHLMGSHGATLNMGGMAGDLRSRPPAPDLLHELEDFSQSEGGPLTRRFKQGMVWDTLVIPYRSRDRGEAWHGIHVTRLREVELGHLGALQGAAQALQTDPGSRFDTQAVLVLALTEHNEIKTGRSMTCIRMGPCDK